MTTWPSSRSTATSVAASLTPRSACARKRIFTSGYIKSHYLEIGVELQREATHPMLRTTFPTSKKVVMHRLTLREREQFDDALRELITQAWETVGPGLR
ncbi:MAG: hypothetical protein H0T66_04515 [Geodermatophilaceae bacterium]|nr:hypothetical protein [Geodermatophilaceae bacterium]